MIYQYRCDLCSLKVKIKRHLVEHLLEQHGVEQVEAGEVRETTELVLTQEENGQVSVLVQDVQQEVQVERCKASERQSKRVVRELKSVLVKYNFPHLRRKDTFSHCRDFGSQLTGWQAEGVGKEGGKGHGQAAEGRLGRWGEGSPD